MTLTPATAAILSDIWREEEPAAGVAFEKLVALYGEGFARTARECLMEQKQLQLIHAGGVPGLDVLGENGKVER